MSERTKMKGEGGSLSVSVKMTNLQPAASSASEEASENMGSVGGPFINSSRKNKVRPRAMGGEIVKFLLLVLSYYASNIFVVTTNKQLISLMDFHFPVLLTCIHMVTTLILSYVFLDVLVIFKKQDIASKAQRQKITFLALIFAVSLMCGNWSLKFIHVSFMQMVGASTPFFVCLLGFLIFHQVHHWRVYCSLVPIAVGAILSTYGEKNLNMLGFILTLLSTLLRGLKTVWQGHLLQGEERLDSPNLLRYMALDAGLILFVFFLVFESQDFATWLQSEGSDTYKFWHFALLLTLNPAAAYLANWSQFMLIQKSSALTFQVIGNTKGVINAVAGIMVFGNEVTALAVVGYSITLSGVALYTREKRRSPK